MSDVILGKIIEEENPQRDAFHIAVAPVIAGEMLFSGQHVGLDKDGKATANPPFLGIVDPYLPRGIGIAAGQKFYLCLYQKTVTGMRHAWEHPSFPDKPTAPKITSGNEHEKWIAEFADSCQLHVTQLMNGAEQYIDYGEYLCLGGQLECMTVPDEFWVHYEKLKGKRGEGSFFTCSC